MHADVARQIFQTLAQLHQLIHAIFAGNDGVELRLHLARLRQRYRLHAVERHQLGEPVAQAIREIQHAADISDHALGSHGAKGGDLRHVLLAIMVAHIFDNTLASVLAEVHVEVGHGNAFRIQEALEQQFITQRIEVGNAQRIRHQRTGAGAAPRPHRHAVGKLFVAERFGPADEVGHDQEVAGKLHVDDGVDLEIQPRLVFRHLGRALRLVRIQVQHTPLQAALRFAAQKVIQCLAVGCGEIRQVRLAQFQREVAALGDLHAVLQRLRQIGEQLRHLGLCLEILLLGELFHTALVVQHIAFGDTHTRLVRLEIVDAQELHRVRGNHRQRQLGGQLHRIAQMRFFARRAVALHFQIKAVGKQPGIFLRGNFCARRIAVQQRRPNFTQMRTGQGD